MYEMNKGRTDDDRIDNTYTYTVTGTHINTNIVRTLRKETDHLNRL